MTHVLAADIGGTYARFAVFDMNAMRICKKVAFPSREKNFQTVLQLLREQAEILPETCAVFVLAVAGRVPSGKKQHKHIALTNLPYDLDCDAVRQICAPCPIVVINDFEAQARACMTSCFEGARLLGGAPMFARPSSLPASVTACGRVLGGIIGAGTGLGQASLIRERQGEGYDVLPSEGGHAAFAPQSEEEWQLSQYIRERKGREVQVEDVLSGSGLAHIHAFLTGEEVEPEVFTRREGFAQRATRASFARCYGSACREFVFRCLSDAGLVVTGGLVAKTPAILEHPAFYATFIDMPSPYDTLLQTMPLWHMCDPDAGLWGAAQKGRDWLLQSE